VSTRPSSGRTHASKPPRVLVIYKKSAYQIYVRERRHAHIEQLVQARDPSALRLVRAHQAHLQAVEDARFRHRSDDTHAQNVDLVVTLGGDGTLLWASRLVAWGTPIVAINTAPKHSVGYFCAGSKRDMGEILSAALSGKLPHTKLTRMMVTVNDQVLSKRVLNDALYCHECPASTSRYTLRLGRELEHQKSSGMWIGPAAGSSAAQHSAGGDIMPIDSEDLQFVVREPYEVEGGYKLKHGFVKKAQTLQLQSHIRVGRLYLDGPHTVHAVDMAARIQFKKSPEPLLLLGFSRKSGRK
jgi:NAD+ kinase